MQFADIKNDIAFRKIFGNEKKTEILISFLNAVLKLEGTKQINWVEILNPYQLPIVLGAKSTILDDKGLSAAYTEANQHSWTKKDLEAYEYARMRETDDIAREMFVNEKAKMREKLDIAKKMVLADSENDFIAQMTGLPLEQIEQLRAEKE